jgi:DNA-binding transcriptional MerR regulator
MLLDATEAATMLGIPAHTLRRYATLGHIPSVKFSRAPNAHRFYNPDVIEALRRGGLAALDNHNGDGGKA